MEDKKTPVVEEYEEMIKGASGTEIKVKMGTQKKRAESWATFVKTLPEVKINFKYSFSEKKGIIQGLHLLSVFDTGNLALKLSFTNLQFYKKAGDYFLYNFVYSSPSKKVVNKTFKKIVEYSKGGKVCFVRMTGSGGKFETQGGLSELNLVHNCNRSSVILQFAFVDKIE